METGVFPGVMVSVSCHSTPQRRQASTHGMQLAKQMMREGSSTILDVATRVGYDSEAAFNRAFKRATGSPPAAWRKGALGA